MTQCDHDRLEALAFGELDERVAGRVEAHARGCAGCRDELAWLRAERAAFADRADAAAPLAPALWHEIAASIQQVPAPRAAVRARSPRRRERLRWFGFGMAAAAAAAAVLVVAIGRPSEPAPGVASGPPAASDGEAARGDGAMARAERAVADAERAQLAAIEALEAAYREGRRGLEPAVAARYDATFDATRRALADARAAAGDDLEARWLLLDAYAAHRSSLQTVLYELKESP